MKQSKSKNKNKNNDNDNKSKEKKQNKLNIKEFKDNNKNIINNNKTIKANTQSTKIQNKDPFVQINPQIKENNKNNINNNNHYTTKQFNQHDQSISVGKSGINKAHYVYYTATANLQIKKEINKIKECYDIHQEISKKKLLLAKAQEQCLSKVEQISSRENFNSKYKNQKSEESIIDKIRLTPSLTKIKSSKITNKSLQPQTKLATINEDYKSYLIQKLKQQKQIYQQNYKQVLKQKKKIKKIVYQDSLIYLNQELQKMKKGRIKKRLINNQQMLIEQIMLNSQEFKLSPLFKKKFVNNSDQKIKRSNTQGSQIKLLKNFKINETQTEKQSSSLSLKKQKSNISQDSGRIQGQIFSPKKINYLQHKNNWLKGNQLFIKKIKTEINLSPSEKFQKLKGISQGYKQFYKNGKKEAVHSIGLAALAKADLYLKSFK